MADKKVGDVIEAGEFLLFTSGSYSDFGVVGIFRATQRFELPGRESKYGKPGEIEIDTEKIASDPTLVEGSRVHGTVARLVRERSPNW